MTDFTTILVLCLIAVSIGTPVIVGILAMCCPLRNKVDPGPEIDLDSLEVKWSSYTGTSLAAKKGQKELLLRERHGEGFAIVMHDLEAEEDPIEVIEEVLTPHRLIAEQRFHQVARENGFVV